MSESKAKEKQDRLRDPIWQFIGVVVTAIALFFSIFVWFVPNRNQLFPVSATPPTKVVVVTPTVTPTNHPSSNQTSSWLSIAWDSLAKSFITSFIVGIIAGILANKFFPKVYCSGIFMDTFLGFVGSFIVSSLTQLFIPNGPLWFIVIFACFGSFILISIVTLIAPRPRSPDLPY